MEEKIILTNQNYHYKRMQQDITQLKRKYPFLEIGSIGKSVLKKEIMYIKIGNGSKQILYHARNT